MIPSQDTNIATEGVALLTSHYAGKPVVTGIIQALMARLQIYENAFFQLLAGMILDNHPMAGGPWDILDKLGALVGVPRNGMTDADYVLAIRLAIRVNRSHGLAEDIIQISGLIVSGAIYREWFPAAWEVQVIPTTTSIVNALIANLFKAKSAGTAGYIRSSDLSLSNLLTWEDSVAGGVGVGWADSVSGTPNNAWASLLPIG